MSDDATRAFFGGALLTAAVVVASFAFVQSHFWDLKYLSYAYVVLPGFFVLQCLNLALGAHHPHPMLDRVSLPIVCFATWAIYFLLIFAALKLFRFGRQRKSST
jgi:hypothetical protein